MNQLGVLVVTVACVACTQPASTECGGGIYCPQGKVCAHYGDPVQTFCVTPEQTAMCDGLADGAQCATTPPSTCRGGACFADICGDGTQDASEACDDGNTIDGDGCSADCRSNEACGNNIIDLSTGEQCDDANTLGHDGCSGDCKVEHLVAAEVEDDVPSSRFSQAAAYDADLGAIVMFGGGDGLYPARDTMFTWDGLRWRRQQPPSEPSPRTESALAYDIDHHAVVLFGGQGLDETWVFQNATWTQLLPARHPGLDRGPEMVYEPTKHRAILVHEGGTWAWDGATWTELPQSDPLLKRGFASLAYDAKRGIVVMFGGEQGIGSGGTATTVFNDTWELEGDTWVQKAPMPTTAPSARYRAASAFSPADQEIVIAGGNNAGTHPPDAWTWNGVRWNRIADPPGDREGGDLDYSDATAATDAQRGRFVLLHHLSYAMEWTGTAWVVGGGTAYENVPPFGSMAAASDAQHHRVVEFGGIDNLSFGTIAPARTFIWKGHWFSHPVNTTYPGPTARYGASMIYDARRNEFMMFGGNTGSVAVGETWTMTLTSADFPTWTQVTVAGSKPPARYRAAMVYDVLSGTALLFGGYDGTTTFDDFWKWDGATRTWTKLPSGPPARRSPAMGFDPIAKKLFLFSGRAANGTFLPDAWQWDGTAWNQLTTGTPSPRNDARMAWDAARGRLVLAGGSTSAGDLTGDVWELDGAHGTWEYQPVSPVPRDGLEMLSSIDDRAGVLLLGGFDLNGDAIDDFSRIGRDGDAQYETCRGIDVDADNHIDCDDADCWAFCTPQCTPGMDCTGLPRTCGDGVAVPELEQCTTCPEDAGACATLCGNLVCDPDEEMASCPGDCFN